MDKVLCHRVVSRKWRYVDFKARVMSSGMGCDTRDLGLELIRALAFIFQLCGKGFHA
jgi:hypothetical protein